MAQSHGYLRTPDLPRCCHFVAVAFTRLHGPRMRHVELLQSLGFMVDTRYIYIYDDDDDIYIYICILYTHSIYHIYIYISSSYIYSYYGL
jgi:hypothetical protein